VLLGVTPYDYSRLSTGEKTLLAGKIRKQLASEIDLPLWASQTKTVIWFQEKLRELLKPANLKQLARDFEKTVAIPTPRAVEAFVIRVDPLNLDLVAGELSLLIDNAEFADLIVGMLTEKGLEQTKRKMETVERDVEDGMFSYISNSLGAFVIFINPDGTVYKYPVPDEERAAIRKVILVKYLPGHFESVGIANPELGVIQRSFDIRDPIIAPLVAEI
jgi:hypothetical protein